MIEIKTRYMCSKCKGSVDTVYNINKLKHGYDYEPEDFIEETSMYKCIGGCSGVGDLEDFLEHKVELNGHRCSKCNSDNLALRYFDYFSNCAELKCNKCNAISKVEVD